MSLVLENLSKTLGGKQVLHPLNLTLPPGTTTALLGLNGAGKSTLLKILAGLLTPDTGTLTGQPPSLAYMPDSVVFPKGLRAQDWLFYLAKLRGVPLDRAREILKAVGLESEGRRPAFQFSRGMHQRLLFAQLLLDDPQLILMDEPENGLDPFWVSEWKLRVNDLKAQGRTLIFSTHLLADAVEVADRILVFHRGQLIDDQPSSHWAQVDPSARFLSLVRAVAP